MALRHFWVHRLHLVFNALGIRPTEAMLACEEELRSLAALAVEVRSDPGPRRILYVAVAEHKRFPVE